MGVSDKDIKMLWGRAAGRCSYPGYMTSCIDFFADETFLIGEMAHIIARQPAGPRGIVGGGGNKYDNLILLCPTHHRMIDKAPLGNYPKKELIRWKERHEQDVEEALESPPFRTIGEVCRYIEKLLIENKTVWQTYGPESTEATSNPYSNLAQLWPLRKLERIRHERCQSRQRGEIHLATLLNARPRAGHAVEHPKRNFLPEVRAAPSRAHRARAMPAFSTTSRTRTRRPLQGCHR